MKLFVLTTAACILLGSALGVLSIEVRRCRCRVTYSLPPPMSFLYRPLSDAHASLVSPRPVPDPPLFAFIGEPIARISVRRRQGHRELPGIRN
jgi:hypothetical protein